MARNPGEHMEEQKHIKKKKQAILEIKNLETL